MEKILQADKRNSTLQKSSGKLKDLLSKDPLSFPDDFHNRNECFGLFKDFTNRFIKQCEEVDLFDLVVMLQLCQLKCIKMFFQKEYKFNELKLLGKQLDIFANVMSKYRCSENTKKIHELMEEVLLAMQTDEDVVLKIKCHDVARFMTRYCNCLFTCGDFREAVELSTNAGFLLQTTLPKDDNQHKTLAKCYQITAMSYIELKEKRIAQKWFEKAKEFASKTKNWKNEEKKIEFMKKLNSIKDKLS